MDTASFNARCNDGEDKGTGATIERKTCTTWDGVLIVYSAAGSGLVGLVFIHGGLANRTFWDGELKEFAAHYRVIAPDLAGHGESGTNRTPAVVADAEQRMAQTSPEVTHTMFLSLAGYDVSASARYLQVPLLAINGDLYPTDTQAVRTVKADFDVVVMKHVGHYPMLERPAEFDRLVAAVADRLRIPLQTGIEQPSLGHKSN
jgi:pimeloyl-ACP methyl ester carboxylesterase